MTGDELKVVRPFSMDFAEIGLISRWFPGLAELDGAEVASYVHILILGTKSAGWEQLT